MSATVTSLAAAVPSSLFVERVPASAGSDAPIVDLTHDSRAVVADGGFACIVGGQVDGHDFAEAAVAAGARLLVVERRLPLDVDQIVVSDVRRAIGPLAAAVHGHPAERLRTIGVTGTNGKTTTVTLLGAIARHAGLSERRIGTLSGRLTTPEATDLQRRLARFVDDGVDLVAMEVSSHALELHRVGGITFDVAVFTNLGRDHLDLHTTLEAYFRAKARLFEPTQSKIAVVNRDDPHGSLLVDLAPVPVRPFGFDDISDVDVEVGRIRFGWRGHQVVVPIGGAFNVANALAALSAAEAVGIDPAVAVAGLATADPVPGRFEVVTEPSEPVQVVVDYAHTPDGIDELLSAARRLVEHGRLIVVLGAGGDRDHDKRPLMGAAAVRGADLAVVTSDNPRTEDPVAIVTQVASGIEGQYRDRFRIEVDRRTAIGLAIAEAAPGDVVVIAGRGHETTQSVAGREIPFDDRVVAREWLDKGDPS